MDVALLNVEDLLAANVPPTSTVAALKVLRNSILRVSGFEIRRTLMNVLRERP